MESIEKTITESTESKITKPDPESNLEKRYLKKKATWQRLGMTIIGIAIMIFIWQWAVWNLYSLPPEAIAAFTTITVNVFYTIAAIVLFFVTGKFVYDLRVDTVNTVITEGRNLLERKTETIKEDRTSTENINYREFIVEEGQPDAPEVKPFAQIAEGDDREGEYKLD